MSIKVIGQLKGILRSTDNQVMVDTGNGYASATDLGIDPFSVVIPTRYGPGGKQQILTERGYIRIDIIAGDTVLAIPKGVSSLYKRPGRKATRQVATRMAAVANGAIGYCYHNNLTVEADVIAIRPTLNNVHTAALTSVKISVAPTSDFSLVNAPSGAWVDGTFGNGAATSGTASARLAAEQPSLTRPDWIMINSVVPTDGGTLRYFCVRHFVPAANATTSEGNYDLSTMFHVPSDLNDGRIFQTFRQDVDGIASKAAFTSTTPYGKPGLIMGWDYLLASGEIRTVAGFGDSIMEGAVNGGTGNFGNGWLYQAIRQFRRQNPGVLIEHANYGIATQNTTTFNQLAVERIPRVDPDIIVYSPFSCNDGTPTATTLNTQAGLNATMQTTGKTANSPVIYVMGCPNTALGWTAAQDLYRRYSNIFFQGEQRMSFNRIDMDADLWDGVSAFKPTVTTDGTHPNDLGHGLVATNQAYPALRKAIFGY